MSSDAPVGAESEHSSTSDSVRYWVATFLRYLELRLQLFGLEAKEAGLHLLIIGLLVTGILALFAGFLVMFAVFLLYLIITLLHWEWGWGALLCAGILLVTGGVAAVVLRYRVSRPMFRMTLDELQKDREWLRSTTRNTE
jgi:uncharacterized membrane protein YqjE